MKKRKNRQK